MRSRSLAQRRPTLVEPGTRLEPSLWQAAADGTRERYRFTWLPSFGHPVAIRFEVTGAAAAMRVVELDGAGGAEPGAIDRTRPLTAPEWSAIAAHLAAARFWSMPPDEPGVIRIRADDEQWILEGARGGDYHVVDRWTPSSNPDHRGLRPLLEACRAAIAVAGLPPPAE